MLNLFLTDLSKEECNTYWSTLGQIQHANEDDFERYQPDGHNVKPSHTKGE